MRHIPRTIIARLGMGATTRLLTSKWAVVFCIYLYIYCYFPIKWNWTFKGFEMPCKVSIYFIYAFMIAYNYDWCCGRTGKCQVSFILVMMKMMWCDVISYTYTMILVLQPRVRAQSFTCCSPLALHARLGSKLGAQSCRIDHYKWVRLVGDPRILHIVFTWL